jgi:hypothetical protein
MLTANHLRASFNKSLRTFINVLPIIVGMLLMTSLAVTLFPEQISAGLFGNGNILDSLLAATVGSIAAGHPLASYLLGGELLGSGVGLIAVTALLVTWVTVGVAQLPAESLMLGTRFAMYCNIISFIAAIAISFLVVYTLRLFGVS